MDETVKVKNVRLTVETGNAWATRTGHSEDRLIAAGQRINLVGGGWVVGPLGPTGSCCFEVTPLKHSLPMSLPPFPVPAVLR